MAEDCSHEGFPQLPTWLTEDGERVWHALLPRLIVAGQATELDSAAVGMLASLLAVIIRARQDGREIGEDYEKEAMIQASTFGLKSSFINSIELPPPAGDLTGEGET